MLFDYHNGNMPGSRSASCNWRAKGILDYGNAVRRYGLRSYLGFAGNYRCFVPNSSLQYLLMDIRPGDNQQ